MHTPALPAAMALVLALGLAAAPAHADQSRSFVSGLGNDANAPDCTRTAPCRTFQAAHNSTLPNGEITVLDPGSYGAVAINRNISIVNDGMGEAGLLVSGGGSGITVVAPGAAVTLRGLTIKGIGFGGGNGIVFAAGATLNVENCSIRNLDGNPLRGIGIFSTATSGSLHVTNTVVTDNSAAGIFIWPSGTAAVTAVLDRVGLYSNGLGGLVAQGDNASGGKIAVAVNESVASYNGTAGPGSGFQAKSAAGAAQTIMMLTRSVAANNTGTGVLVSGANAVIGVNASLIFNNASGWAGPANSIGSAGNNVVQGNAADEGPMPVFPLR